MAQEGLRASRSSLCVSPLRTDDINLQRQYTYYGRRVNGAEQCTAEGHLAGTNETDIYDCANILFDGGYLQR